MPPDFQTAGVWQLSQADQELRLPPLHTTAGRKHSQPQETSKTTPRGIDDQGVWIVPYMSVVINPRRMREGYGSRSVCVCECVSVT